jgi:hypothetical protein
MPCSKPDHTHPIVQQRPARIGGLAKAGRDLVILRTAIRIFRPDQLHRSASLQQPHVLRHVVMGDLHLFGKFQRRQIQPRRQRAERLQVNLSFSITLHDQS